MSYEGSAAKHGDGRRRRVFVTCLFALVGCVQSFDIDSPPSAPTSVSGRGWHDRCLEIRIPAPSDGRRILLAAVLCTPRVGSPAWWIVGAADARGDAAREWILLRSTMDVVPLDSATDTADDVDEAVVLEFPESLANTILVNYRTPADLYPPGGWITSERLNAIPQEGAVVRRLKIPRNSTAPSWSESYEDFRRSVVEKTADMTHLRVGAVNFE
jgi:hypothetical protein